MFLKGIFVCYYFISSSTQFEELYGPFVNLGAHLPSKDNSPFFITNSSKSNCYCFIFIENKKLN